MLLRPLLIRFSTAAVLWSVSLFGLLRLPWIEDRALAAMADVQRTIAQWYGAPHRTAVVVDNSCTGVDVMAVCAGICLAFPVSWRLRVAGAATGAALLFCVNTLRIATLLAVGPTDTLFNTLHVYVWPVALIIVAVTYVLVWTIVLTRATRRATLPAHGSVSGILRRFLSVSFAFLAVYAVAAPWLLTSATMLTVAQWTTAVAGRVLALVNLPASAHGNVLITDRGAFQVTQECLLTPLLPLYFGLTVSLPLSRHAQLLGIGLAVPVFFALGVLRALVLALPPTVALSPLAAAHNFYQVVAAAAIVAAVCVWSEYRRRRAGLRWRASLRFVSVSCAALLIASAADQRWRGLVIAAGNLVTAEPLQPRLAALDIQGTVTFLPPYQLALFSGVFLGVTPRRWRRYAAALPLLAAAQVAVLVAIAAVGEHVGGPVHPLGIRAIAIAVPLLFGWLFVSSPGSPGADFPTYRRFWDHVGRDFPDLGGAASTALYARDERALLSRYLQLRGCRLLKSDLWDEAKNTRILQWAAGQGADVTGIDLSYPIVRDARTCFGSLPLRCMVADVRTLPLRDGVFDAVYSMGTIEHFAESGDAVVELARVLKPGGRLILGVPNRHDPFLRPLLAAALQKLGVYGYGFEKSFSRRQLRAMVERADLDVVAETGILFVPGWLRMLDLVCHTRGWTRIERSTAIGVGLFSRLSGRYPRLRRHGYLLATVAVRRAAAGGTGRPIDPRGARTRVARGVQTTFTTGERNA